MTAEQLPNVAQSVQFDHKLLGERYCTEGFYGIMKLQNYRADYQRAVHRLAERIVDIGDATVSPMQTTSQLMIAGRRTSNRCPVPSARTARARTAGGQLQISVLAHDISTLPPGRAG